MSEIEIFDNSYFINKLLNKIDFSSFSINFIGIIREQNRDDFIFNPNKDTTTIHKNDFLIVIGYEKTINEFKTYIQTKNIEV